MAACPRKHSNRVIVPTKDAPVVLLVDDEQDILDLLTYNFQMAGLTTQSAGDGRSALERARREPPDLVVLDIMMPFMDGYDVCRAFRSDTQLRHIPVLMLTALPGDENHIKGLDAGADSYLPKTKIGVVISQAKALLRGVRRREHSPARLQVHDLEIDRDRYVVYRHAKGERVALRFPRKEFDLLHFLASSPGLVFTRPELLDRVWGTDVHVVDRTVDVHIRKIREKLGKKYIDTVKGVGYRFAEKM